MCGIAGALDLTGTREFPAPRLRAMTAAIAHRGPDDEHHHREPGLALGARRLAIVDLAGGRQPIANEDRSVWVAFNGELFDYPELRKTLLARGHHLATRCDTEAWVHLYEDHGDGHVRARPRPVRRLALGPRPPHPAPGPRPRRHLPALLRRRPTAGCSGARRSRRCWPRGWSRPRPDPAGVDHFFHFFCAGTTRTFFQGVKSLPPGHFLEVARRPGRGPPLLGPRLPRRRRGAAPRRPDPAGRRAGGPAGPGGRASAAGRRAGGQLPQRRPRLDGGARPGGEAAGRRGAVVHDRAGPGRAGRALAGDGVGRGAGLAADDGDDGPGHDRGGLPRADPRRRGAGPRHVVRLPAAAGRGGPRPGVQGGPDGRGGRRGARRLRLVQGAEDPRTAFVTGSARSSP